MPEEKIINNQKRIKNSEVLLVIPAYNVIPIPDGIDEDVVSFFDAFGNATHTALMFDVIGELIEHCLTLPEEVATFAAMSKLVKDPDLKSGRDKMKAMYERMDQFPASCGKMDRKAKLFFGFSVYAAHNVISENDDKRHHLYGIAEFESVEFIKYKMEEYWAMDPYMFSFAFN